MVISYEIYEGDFHKFHMKMTTSVRFCLSYDPLKRNFTALKIQIITMRKRIVDTTLAITLRVRAIVSLHVWLYDFYCTTLSTE